MTVREHVVKRAPRYQAVWFDGFISSARSVESYVKPGSVFHEKYGVTMNRVHVNGKEIPNFAYLEVEYRESEYTGTIVDPCWFVFSFDEQTMEILTEDEYRSQYRKVEGND